MQLTNWNVYLVACVCVSFSAKPLVNDKSPKKTIKKELLKENKFCLGKLEFWLIWK